MLIRDSLRRLLQLQIGALATGLVTGRDPGQPDLGFQLVPGQLGKKHDVKNIRNSQKSEPPPNLRSDPFAAPRILNAQLTRHGQFLSASLSSGNSKNT